MRMTMALNYSDFYNKLYVEQNVNNIENDCLTNRTEIPKTVIHFFLPEILIFHTDTRTQNGSNQSL